MINIYKLLPHLFLCQLSFGQPNLDIRPFYEKINQKHIKIDTRSLNLISNVKSVTEIISTNNANQLYYIIDTISIRKFNQAGLLTEYVIGDTTAYRYHYESYQFNPATKQLEQVIIKNDYEKSTIITTFNSGGFIDREIFNSGTEELFNKTAFYKYNDLFSQVEVTYEYEVPDSYYERDTTENYLFIFDKHGNLIHESLQGRYGYSKIITYDTVSNLPVGIFHRSNCATQNSCLIYNASMAYDKKGNLLYASLSDQTIRNAGWSYSYCYVYELNDKNEIITKIGCLENKYPMGPSLEQVPGKVIYEYEYDQAGNWIKKFEYYSHPLSDKQLTSITHRGIEYY